MNIIIHINLILSYYYLLELLLRIKIAIILKVLNYLIYLILRLNFIEED